MVRAEVTSGVQTLSLEDDKISILYDADGTTLAAGVVPLSIEDKKMLAYALLDSCKE